MEAAVYCSGITKSYHTGGMATPALRGIDLSIGEGELCMLVGPSGCGKTTLISVIAGILDSDEGECRVFGTNMKMLRDDERAAFRGKNVGFVFQAYNLIPTLTNEENVAIPLLLLGASRTHALKQAREMLGSVGLGEKASSAPTQLSGGQQQRVAIARALVHTPRMIVCDEPTSALDHQTGVEIMELFKSVAMNGKCTLVIVTHDARIYQYADRIAQMDDGRVVRVGAPRDILHAEGENERV